MAKRKKKRKSAPHVKVHVEVNLPDSNESQDPQEPHRQAYPMNEADRELHKMKNRGRS